MYYRISALSALSAVVLESRGRINQEKSEMMAKNFGK